MTRDDSFDDWSDEVTLNPQPVYTASLVIPETPEFRGWPKIARLNRHIVITEKIDGTNACVIVTPDGRVFAQSRTRILSATKKGDNYGFASWVEANATALSETLGVGYHYGEWWGSGIQRGYGWRNGERFFSLFNTARWGDLARTDYGLQVVPELYRGPFSPPFIEGCVRMLRSDGTRLQCGHTSGPRPDAEGIVIFHSASSQLFKVTLEGDEAPKTSVTKTVK